MRTKKFQRDQHFSSGEISLLFPGNVSIKCCLRLREIRGWTGRGHLQSETAFHRDSSGQISLLFPGNVSICLPLNNFDVLCILNTFEQFRYVMNCFYLCIHHFTPRLFRCFLHRYGIDIRPVLILSLQFLAPDSLHSDHRYGEDTMGWYGVLQRGDTTGKAERLARGLRPKNRETQWGKTTGRPKGEKERWKTTGKWCKMSTVTFIAGKQEKVALETYWNCKIMHMCWIIWYC